MRASAALLVVAVVGAGCSPPTVSPPAGLTGASSGCGTTTVGAVTDQADTVAVDGTTRRYTITVPSQHAPGTTTPLPLVLDFHGLLEGWSGTHPYATQFSSLANSKGFVVAYPIGTFDGLLWDLLPQESNPDLRYVDALLAKLESTMCIDQSRIYITGLSYGAMMTSMLMCMRANTFAAAAPVAGLVDLCQATDRKVPFLSFHGTNDPILPYSNFGKIPAEIAAKYGCAPTPTEEVLQPTPDPGTGGAIVRTTWDCSAVNSAAVFYRVEGGGHSWPGSAFFGFVAPIVGRTATSIDATAIMWDFFTKHHL